jgi:Glycosyltransferase family 87
MTGDALDGLRAAFGFRVIFRIGPVRLLRVFTALAVILASASWLGHWGWNAAAIGQDTWNYLGAGERLNAGHSIYALVAGDRPILIELPSTVPLVSPPLVAVLWRPLALLPDWLAMWGWWAASAAAMLATTMWIVLKGRWQVVLMVFVLATAIGECAVSGNLNSFLAPAMALSWWSVQVGRPRVAGSLTALGAVLKIGPAALLLWLAVRREGRAIVAFAIGAAALAAISLLGAGLQQHLDFLSVARGSTDTGGWGGSVPGILSQLKASQTVIELSIPAVWIVGAALIWALRHHPAGAFAVVVILTIWGTPVVHLTAVALLLAVGAPFTPAPGWLGPKAAAPAPQVI